MNKYVAETRQKKRNVEPANGRLAMLYGRLVREKIPARADPRQARFAGDYAGTMPGNPLPSTMHLSMVF